ncbi:galactosylgalactosylxylosylprotein 3-beta-glucuronosyltransferase 3-like [Tropilaelaps mercedesae]|uniref:Galactosylgalactosylxylosylprotein 3-beta-glucuronosyltransferase n=1 Tax=Tropilaelaps mercedesae TaxID=418985 RepID=A0A1V9Y0D0_9ACAR|nr:galactosylgalactosylxylosylprotein 3-beta-glucuronosyltransferase 3-like [Tropilaelaps mercedesae]
MRHRFVPYAVGAFVGFVTALLLRWETSAVARTSSLQRAKDPQRLVCLVTPTHARPQQKAELTRLSYAFRLAGRVHWIVVEDAEAPSALVSHILADSGLSYTHLTAATPEKYKLGVHDPNWLKPRGVLQRNAALRFLRSTAAEAASVDDDAVVYFADDDNTYDIRLFDEMRLTKKVSVWPVGLVGGLMVERPIVVDGRVKRFNAVFRPDRPYPVDMAAFAVSLSLIREHPTVLFSLNVKRGYQESHLLTQLLAGWEELEPRANNCSKVYVWHTRTEMPNLKPEAKQPVHSNKDIEV